MFCEYNAIMWIKVCLYDTTSEREATLLHDLPVCLTMFVIEGIYIIFGTDDTGFMYLPTHVIATTVSQSRLE